MRINRFLLSASLIVSGCYGTAVESQSEPVVSKVNDPKPVEKSESEILAELRSVSKEQDNELKRLGRENGYKISHCLHRNASEYNKVVDIIAPMINGKPEFGKCTTADMDLDMECAYDILQGQGKTSELIEYLRIANGLSEKVFACVRDNNNWDPSLTAADYRGELQADHPDPDIRLKVREVLDSELGSNKELNTLRRSAGPRLFMKAEDQCIGSPQFQVCHNEHEQAASDFHEHPTKESRIKMLETQSNCNQLLTRCIIDFFRNP